MAEENELNLEAVAEKYNLFDVNDLDGVLNRITFLDEEFCREDLIRIYNYLISKIASK